MESHQLSQKPYSCIFVVHLLTKSGRGFTFGLVYKKEAYSIKRIKNMTLLQKRLSPFPLGTTGFTAIVAGCLLLGSAPSQASNDYFDLGNFESQTPPSAQASDNYFILGNFESQTSSSEESRGARCLSVEYKNWTCSETNYENPNNPLCENFGGRNPHAEDPSPPCVNLGRSSPQIPKKKTRSSTQKGTSFHVEGSQYFQSVQGRTFKQKTPFNFEKVQPWRERGKDEREHITVEEIEALFSEKTTKISSSGGDDPYNMYDQKKQGPASYSRGGGNERKDGGQKELPRRFGVIVQGSGVLRDWESPQDFISMSSRSSPPQDLINVSPPSRPIFQKREMRPSIYVAFNLKIGDSGCLSSTSASKVSIYFDREDWRVDFFYEDNRGKFSYSGSNTYLINQSTNKGWSSFRVGFKDKERTGNVPSGYWYYSAESCDGRECSGSKKLGEDIKTLRFFLSRTTVGDRVDFRIKQETERYPPSRS